MSDASHDSYRGLDGQPGYFDYDDPRDYECSNWAVLGGDVYVFMENVIVRRLTRLSYKARSTNRS